MPVTAVNLEKSLTAFGGITESIVCRIDSTAGFADWVKQVRVAFRCLVHRRKSSSAGRGADAARSCPVPSSGLARRPQFARDK